MTTFEKFSAVAKMRHDFSDQIQVRYAHPNGEMYDTWISGDEVMQRLDSRVRQRLIESFSRKNRKQMRDSIEEIAEQAKDKLKQDLRGRLADAVSDNIGGNIFGDTFSDNIRGVDSSEDPHQREKELWQSRLHDEAFHALALELAWINLDGSLPEEEDDASQEWV